MSTELLTGKFKESLREVQALPTPSQYRYDTVKEFQQRLQEHIDVYTVKKKEIST